jgi:CheY-like chemotaxis protein
MATGRILVVDDEPFFQELFREALSSAGHATRTAGSAQEALTLLGEDRFDLLVTDIVMPGLDGIGLVREARRRDPELEAVAVTGHEDVRLAVQAMKAGCTEFLTKPVDRGELAEVADRVLQRVQLRREHSQLLNENLEYARSQAIYRQGLQILSTLDGERLQDLVLAILARVTDAQGAALWLLDEKGQLQLRSYRGLVDRAALPPLVDPRDGRWAAVFQPGGPQLDPFGGTGTVAVVAKRTGRHFIHIDVSQKYCQIAAQRLEA